MFTLSVRDSRRGYCKPFPLLMWSFVVSTPPGVTDDVLLRLQSLHDGRRACHFYVCDYVTIVGIFRF